MSKHQESLKSLIRKKLNVLEGSDATLVANVKKDEAKVLREVLEIIKAFDTLNGRIVQDGSNLQKLTSLKKDLARIIDRTKYQSNIAKYLFDFDLAERLSRSITTRITGLSTAKVNLSAEKLLAIEEIASRLTSAKSIDVALNQPIKKLLFRHITLGSSIKDATKSLTDFIAGAPDQKLGLMTRHVSTIAQTAISEWSGTVNKAIADELKTDGFLIVGSLIKTSRSNCVEMINGSGRFKSLAVAPGLYRNVDIPKIIELAKDRPG